VAAGRGLADAGKVLRVRHEQLVEDFEAKVRRILEFVGLDFEMACLESYKTERSVRTASSEQVRRPFQRRGSSNGVTSSVGSTP